MCLHTYVPCTITTLASVFTQLTPTMDTMTNFYSTARIDCFCFPGQNSSSALRQRDSLSRVRRASASATDISPWTLLSLVRTLTVLVIFSFSPTTVRTQGDKQLEEVQLTQHNTHDTHNYPNCATKLALLDVDEKIKQNYKK